MESLKSSTGSGKISRTVKGIATQLIPVFIIIGEQFGVELTQAGLAEGIGIVAGIVGSMVALSGYIRAKRYSK